MNTAKWTRGPWMRDGRTVYALEHAGWLRGVEQFRNRFYVNVQGQSGSASPDELEANARIIAVAPKLYAAAELACLMFERKNHSTADSAWMGDDEHEAWTALLKAMAEARGEA